MAGAATREGVMKNALLNCREAAKRWPEHKELAKKFLTTFEEETDNPDKKHGRRKYMAQLQSAVNRQIETVFIDLNDVERFCAKELANPGGDVVGVNKMQLQQSIEHFVSDIENNTLRYVKYFYQVLDDQKPERDADFSGDSAAQAKDTIQKWREQTVAEQQAQQGTAGQQSAVPAIPSKLRNPFDVRFKPRQAAQPLALREIGAKQVGSLVQIECLVVRMGNVNPKVEVVSYHCEVCGAEIFQTVDGDRYTPPKDCPSQRCQDNKQAGKLRNNMRMNQFVRHQEIRVQEMAEHVPIGGVPRSINCILTGDLTRTVQPGDAITITGVYTPSQTPVVIARRMGNVQQMFIDVHSVQKHKTGYNEGSADMKEVEKVVKEAGDKGTLYERAAKSIAPEIFGHLDVKKALLLVLIGSFTKTMKDGMKIRGDIHTLLMGDPGVAKSQLLKQVKNIAPRSVYTTGKGSSGVGLTASVIRDNLTGEVSLEGGALVLADLGICCIDEFDKMDERDRTNIHEVMEQQSVSIAKSGITTTLNTRTTILAAANPVDGRYNPRKSVIENMDLPAALLSRFDLLFLLLDTVEADKDKNLALHVVKMHSHFNTSTAEAGEDRNMGDGDVMDLGFEPFDARFMRSYIRKAKSYEPLIDDSLQRDIVDAYVAMRDDEKRGDIDSRKSYTTPRTLLAILRLSQAHARARCSEKVERQDFDEAMRLMKASKESVESSIAKKNVNPLDQVYDIVSDLSRRETDGEGWVEMAHVLSMAGNKQLTQEQVKQAIENWESLSVLTMSEDKTKVRFLVPAA